jgi:hypothetical protein
MLVDVLLSSPKVSIITMHLMLVQTSDEDKRPVRSEAMATVKVFSLVFSDAKGGRRIGVY